jgi:hypothetical protein
MTEVSIGYCEKDDMVFFSMGNEDGLSLSTHFPKTESEALAQKLHKAIDQIRGNSVDKTRLDSHPS